MVPSFFIPIENIPLTPSGKLDRGALPKSAAGAAFDNYNSPRTRVERILAEIWHEVLGIAKEKDIIGPESNFFQLGGHSLNAITLVSKINKRFNVNIPLVEIFNAPTIKEFAGVVEADEKTPFTGIEKEEKKEYYQLSYNQQRLWVTYRVDPGSYAYHICNEISLPHAVDPGTIKIILHKLMERHESLRTGCMMVGDKSVQVVKNCASVEVPLEIIDISLLPEEEKSRQRELVVREATNTPFDLAAVPLFRVVLLKTEEQEYRLIITFHHIIGDGWSLELLQQEFSLLYDGYREDRFPSLEPVKLQYKDFARWQFKQMADPVFKDDAKQYWRRQMIGGMPLLQLPLDFNGNTSDKSGAVYRCVIDNPLKEKLQHIALSNNTTLFTVLFCAYNVLLSHFSGQDDIVSFIITAGREYPLLNTIVGYFVKSLLIKTCINPDEDFAGLLQRIIVNFNEAIRYQQYPIELIFGELKIKYPEVSVIFNLLDIDEQNKERQIESFDFYHIPDMGLLHFDTHIELYVSEYQNGIEMIWRYKKALFKPGTIERAARGYLKLCRDITDAEE
jgi:acyl carrier protein